MVILYPLYSFLDHEFWKHMKTCNKSDVIFVWTDTPPHGLVSQHKWHDFPIAPWRALGVAVLAPHIDPLHLKPVAQDLQKISFNAGDLSVDRSPAQMAQERAAIYWCFGMISNDIMWSCMTGHICASHHKHVLHPEFSYTNSWQTGASSRFTSQVAEAPMGRMNR